MALSSLGLLFIGSIPTVIGVAEAIDGQKKQNQQAKERIKFHLTAKLPADGESPPKQAFVVLKDGHVCFDHPDAPVAGGYKFNGFYFGYPGPENHQGLVSMASDDPPALHWLFVDKDTGAVRHGPRSQTLGGHVVGPWSWSDDEEWLVLEGSAQRFVAVQNDDGVWQLHYDRTGGGTDFGPDRSQVDVLLHRELQLGVSSSMVK